MALKTKSFGELINFARATGGGRFNAAGQYEWLPANGPRIDYDPVSRECRGILIEEQRTNLLTRSAEFDDAAWSKVRASVAANATTAPDGALTADKLVESTGTNTHYLLASTASASYGLTHTFSVFVKAGERSRIRFRIVKPTSPFEGVSARFDLVAGVLVGAVNSNGGTGATGLITPVGNGWYRCSVTGLPGSTSELQTELMLEDASGSNTYAGDGTSGVYIWGAQLEVGAFPTSYIPTTTAQVTRAADVCSVNNLSPWYRADEGTLMVEASTNKPLGIGTVFAASLVDPSAPDTNHVLIGRFTESSLTARLAGRGGSPSNNLTVLSPYTAGTTYKTALAWRSGGSAAGANGGEARKAVATFPNIPIGTLQVGALTSTSGLLNGHIRRIRYIPRRISDTELQALTA